MGVRLKAFNASTRMRGACFEKMRDGCPHNCPHLHLEHTQVHLFACLAMLPPLAAVRYQEVSPA